MGILEQYNKETLKDAMENCIRAQDKFIPLKNRLAKKDLMEMVKILKRKEKQ